MVVSPKGTSPVSVERFCNHLADERGLQASTIDSVHTVLHQVLDMAVDDDYIRSNPSDGVLKELKQSHIFKTEKRRGLTKPEQELLLNYLKNYPIYNHWYPIFAVMAGTGLRVGEVTGLRWCDIDLEEEIIDINHTLVYYDHRDPTSKQGCCFNVHTPKTEAGKRQVPMLGFVKEAFLMEREYQQFVGLECKVTIGGYTDFIFLNRDGGTFYQGTLNKTIRRIIRDCNGEVLMKGEEDPVLLPHFSCHSLRHTFLHPSCTNRCINLTAFMGKTLDKGQCLKAERPSEFSPEFRRFIHTVLEVNLEHGICTLLQSLL